MRFLSRTAIAFGVLLAACASLPARPRPPRLLARLNVTSRVDSMVRESPAQGLCGEKWQLRGDTLDLLSVIPNRDNHAVACLGQPVLLVRPQCTLSTMETIFYPETTPVVAIRCPHGAAGYITGFSKATKGGM